MKFKATKGRVFLLLFHNGVRSSGFLRAVRQCLQETQLTSISTLCNQGLKRATVTRVFVYSNLRVLHEMFAYDADDGRSRWAYYVHRAKRFAHGWLCLAAVLTATRVGFAAACLTWLARSCCSRVVCCVCSAFHHCWLCSAAVCKRRYHLVL